MRWGLSLCETSLAKVEPAGNSTSSNRLVGLQAFASSVILRIDMCADMCAHLCAHLCADMCADMCANMYADMCAEMCAEMPAQVDLTSRVRIHRCRNHLRIQLHLDLRKKCV